MLSVPFFVKMCYINRTQYNSKEGVMHHAKKIYTVL